MSSMFNPPRPSLAFRDDILPASNLQVGEAAAQLGATAPLCPKCSMGGLRSALQWHCVLSVGWGATMAGRLRYGWLSNDLWQARVAAKASKTLSGIKALRLQTA